MSQAQKKTPSDVYNVIERHTHEEDVYHERLEAKIDNFYKLVEERREEATRLYAIKLVERIVFGLVTVILISVMGAWIAKIII